MPPRLLSTPPCTPCGDPPSPPSGAVATPPPIGREAPGTWSGLNASVTVPDPLSQLAIVTPGGAWKVSTGRPFSAVSIKSRQIGPATWAPVSLLPSVVGLSKPTHTVVTRSGVKPENQASVKSCVVTVLPAIG